MPAKRSLVVNINTAIDSVDDLGKVKSIGPSLVEDLRPFLKINGKTELHRPVNRQGEAAAMYSGGVPFLSFFDF